MEKGKNITIAILTTIIITLIALIILAYKGIIKVDLKTEKEEIKTEEKQENITLTEQEALGIGTILYDKATEAYETWQLLPYCGMSPLEATRKEKQFFGNDGYAYVDSGMKDIEELKDYLKTFLSEDMVEEKITEEPITDLTLLKNGAYNYVIENNKLYCRITTGKGWLSEYAGKYDIKVKELNDSKIIYGITTEYYVDNNVSESCLNNYLNCKQEELTSEDTEFVIEKNDNGNWIVTKYVLHH